MLKHATGMLFNARTILGLPGKIGNANTSLNRKVGAFFLPVSVHWTFTVGKDNT